MEWLIGWLAACVVFVGGWAMGATMAHQRRDLARYEAEVQLSRILFRKGLGGLERMKRPALEALARDLWARARRQEAEIEDLQDQLAAEVIAKQVVE